MKLRTNPNLTRLQIFDGGYEHPWYKFINKPNPPTQEAIERAKFVDRTYNWSRDDSVRPRKQRVTK